MIKINAKTGERIQSILFSQTDSLRLSESTQKIIYRELLPLLPQHVSFHEFQSALSRFVDMRPKNPEKAFCLFIESLEIFSIRVHDDIQRTDREIQPFKKVKR